MRILSALLAIALMLSNIAMADDSKRDILPPCEGPGCSMVAVKITLKETPETNVLKIRTGSMTVAIPQNVSRIDLGKSIAIFRYETAPHIMISTETKETLELLRLGPKPISLSEAMEIIFTKTVKDGEVTSKYDKELINKLMWIKKGFLGRSSEAYVYDKGRVKIYYLPNGGPPYRNLAWAIDSEHPNSAVRLESDLNGNEFTKILYSIDHAKAKEK